MTSATAPRTDTGPGTAPATTDRTGPGTVAPPTRVEALRARYPWLDHLVRAGARYTEKHGNHYAAAITFFSILALVPLVMVAFAAAGYALLGNQELLTQLQGSIQQSAPAGLAQTLGPIIDQAIESRNAVGIIGLAGALFTGLSWMGNLREALSEQWDQRGSAPGIVAMYAGDLVAMVLLAVAFATSFAITAVGSGLSSTVLELLGLDDQLWARVLLRVATLVATLAANWLVFVLVIARLPREKVTLRSAVRAGLFGAVGFVLLQQVGSIYLASVTNSPTGAAFGPIIGILVFVNLVSRLLLFATAWAATLRENERDEVVAPAPVIVRPAVTVGARPRTRTAAALLGVGAVLGAVGGGLVGRRRS